MSSGLDVPHIEDLADLPVEVVPSDDVGVVSVTALAHDGDVVTMRWDEIASSVNVRWLEGADERLTLERESASKVSIREEEGQVQFSIWLEADGLEGRLLVRVGERVVVTDAVLRR